MRKVISLLLALALTGCATSHVLVGAKRAPISPDAVRVYLEPPAQYEQVAILESSSEGSFAFTAQQKTDKVMARLKAEAAALGANGILIHSIGTGSRGAVMTSTGNAYGSSYIGTGIAVPVMVKEGSALAIHVPVGVAPAAAPPAGTSESQPVPTPAPAPSTQGCMACQSIGKGDL